MFFHLLSETRTRTQTQKKAKKMEGQKQAMKSRVVKIDSEASWDFSISQATKRGSLVVVHFTAAWCMPSVAMNHVFQQVSLSYHDVLFLLVDVDDVKGVAAKMEIKAMPTFLFMKEGAQIDKLVGANPEEIKRRIHGLVNLPKEKEKEV